MSTDSDLSLRAYQVTANYGRRQILFGVDAEIRPGQSVAIVGPNGAGKSTLLNAMTGTLSITSGAITLNGASLRHTPRRGIAREIAVVPQHLEIGFGLTGRDVVSFGRTPYLGFLGALDRADRAAIERAISETDVAAFVDRPFGSLSGGEAQRIVLASALAQETRYLLLDEPTVHLDLGQQWRFMELLQRLQRERNVGILAIVHDLNLAGMIFDEVLVLSHGRVIASGSPAEVLTAKIVEYAFGAPVSVWQDAGMIRIAIDPAAKSQPKSAVS